MDERVIMLTRGNPPTSVFPTGKLAECASAMLQQYGDQILQYGQSRGFAPLREHLADETNSTADQIVVGQGSLSLLDLFIRLVVKPGDWVYTEAPTYDRPLKLLRRAGARIGGIPLENDGPDTNALEQRLQQGEKRGQSDTAAIDADHRALRF